MVSSLKKKKKGNGWNLTGNFLGGNKGMSLREQKWAELDGPRVCHTE